MNRIGFRYMVVLSEQRYIKRVARRLASASIATILGLFLAGCLLSTGCSAAQIASFKVAMDPVAAEVQRQAVEDAAKGDEWDSDDLLKALGGAGLALLGFGGGYATKKRK